MLFQLDQNVTSPINKNELLKSINSNEQKEEIIIDSSEISNQIDLHANKLQIGDRKENEILSYQLQVFERGLDNAIAFGLTDITFIHGVGNGVLRKQIHKILSNRKESFNYYKDAQKEKFGYGATYVKL